MALLNNPMGALAVLNRVSGVAGVVTSEAGATRPLADVTVGSGPINSIACAPPNTRQDCPNGAQEACSLLGCEDYRCSCDANGHMNIYCVGCPEGTNPEALRNIIVAS